MDILPYNFRILHMCGLWSEDNNFFTLKTIYKVFVLYLIFQFTITELMEVATMQGTLNEFTEVIFMTFTYIALCLKLINFVSRRDEMCSLLDDFRLPICRPKSLQEENIMKKYSHTAGKMFIMFMCLAQPTGISMIVTPLLSFNTLYSQLPLRAYQFSDGSNKVYYWIEYVFQSMALTDGIIFNVTMDSMVYGFIIMATGQMEINCFRLRNGTISIKESIEHYQIIRNIVVKIQNLFIRVIVPLFCFSLVTLCASIFQMSQQKIVSLEFLCLSLYLSCMFYQIFFYCWFGNELQLKNAELIDAVYTSNWLDYSVKEKKNMWFIMLSSNYQLSISFHGQCGLTLGTFLWILKTSYAAFNLLQRVELK